MSKYEKLNLILKTMQGIIDDTNLLNNTKRMHRESKAFGAMENIYINTEVSDNHSMAFNQLEDSDDVNLPSNPEILEILNYICSLTSDSIIGYVSSSSDDGVYLSNPESNFLQNIKPRRPKKQNFEPSELHLNENNLSKNKQKASNELFSKNNIKKNFFDIEYRLKVEIKKIELEQNRHLNTQNTLKFQKSNDCHKLNDRRLSCFTPNTQPTSNGLLSSMMKSKRNIQIDGIKSFFKEPREGNLNIEKKKNSIFCFDNFPKKIFTMDEGKLIIIKILK